MPYKLPAILLFSLLAHLVWAKESIFNGEGVDFELISEVESIASGKPFTVGLHVRPHEGFHLYWKNPGIVGLPISMKWDLPEGFTAGPTQWPTPEKVTMAVHPAHGFKRPVTLLVEITPPEKLPSKEISLTADLQWMACADTCHPGNTKLKLQLPVSSKAKRNKSLEATFAKARADLPIPAQDWQVSADILPEFNLVLLRVKSPQLPSHFESLYFYSSNGLVSSDQPQTVKRTRDGTLFLTMSLSEFAPEERTHLPGVLSIQSATSTSLSYFSIAPTLEVIEIVP